MAEKNYARVIFIALTTVFEMVLRAYTYIHEYHTLPRAINKTRCGLLLISQVRHVINVGSYTRIKNTCRCVYTRTRSLCAALISKVSFFTLNYVIHSVQFKSILCSVSVRLCRFRVYIYMYMYVYVYFAIVGETLDAYHVE